MHPAFKLLHFTNLSKIYILKWAVSCNESISQIFPFNKIKCRNGFVQNLQNVLSQKYITFMVYRISQFFWGITRSWLKTLNVYHNIGLYINIIFQSKIPTHQATRVAKPDFFYHGLNQSYSLKKKKKLLFLTISCLKHATLQATNQ